MNSRQQINGSLALEQKKVIVIEAGGTEAPCSGILPCQLRFP